MMNGLEGSKIEDLDLGMCSYFGLFILFGFED